MGWHEKQITASIDRLDATVPARYRQPIPLHPHVNRWAETAATTGLFLTGPIGVGKTAQAWTAVRAWYRATATTRGALHLPTVAAMRATTLFDRLREFTPETPQLVRTLQTADLLYLDDVAAARPTDFTREKLFEILDERYVEMQPVLITSDVLPGDLEPFVGERAVSRLAEMCTGGIVALTGPDRRFGGAE